MTQILDEAWVRTTVAQEGGAKVILDMLGKSADRAEIAETISRALARDIKRMQEER